MGCRMVWCGGVGWCGVGCRVAWCGELVVKCGVWCGVV